MNMRLLKNQHPRTIARAAILVSRVKRAVAAFLKPPKPRLNIFDTERDVIQALETKLKWAYCREIGSDSIDGLEQCDAFHDWVARLLTPRPPQEPAYRLNRSDREFLALALASLAVRQGGGIYELSIKTPAFEHVMTIAAKIDASRTVTRLLAEATDERESEYVRALRI